MNIHPAMVLTLGIVVMPAAASAQASFTASPNPVSEEVRRQLSSAAKQLVAAAELMPPDKFAYRPTDAQMPFGQLVAHVVQTNAAVCSAASNLPIAAARYPSLTLEQIKVIGPSASKETLVAALKQSFEYCTEGFAALTDAQLAEEAVMFGRRTGMSRAGAAITIVADWADHYSTAASYLRLNGILPPSAQTAK